MAKNRMKKRKNTQKNYDFSSNSIIIPLSNAILMC